MVKQKIDWVKSFQRLFKKYTGKRHPLEYKNHYQLINMVVLSARSSDASVNRMAPEFFKVYPTFEKLAVMKPEEIYPLVKTIPGFRKKAVYLIEIAKAIQTSKNIPTTLDAFTELMGIGRKSANVIMSEMGLSLEGVIVDLHTIRVTGRIGITKEINPEKIEKDLMKIFPQKSWGILGMSLTYLGRELCRPTDPNCKECPVNKVCKYYASL